MSNYNPFSLEGKTILVTGASSGIGQATAIECSKLGAKLVVTGRNAERLQQTFKQLEGEGHAQIIAELTDETAIESIVSTSPELNGIVLCAGKGKTLPLSFCSKDKFDEVFSVNFNAPVELLRLLLKAKKVIRQGSVVFVASIAGLKGRTSPGNAMYGASKAALIAMSRFFTREYSNKQFRFNSVCPGMVETPLIRKGMLTEEQLAADMKEYPLGRYGNPLDVAHGIIYLLSDASSWVTGHSLVIDGGVTI